MEKVEFNTIEEHIFNLYYNGSSLREFEQWVYESFELETLLTPEDYLALISLNFKSKHIYNEIENIVCRYVDYGKFETSKVITLLQQVLNRDENTCMVLRQFYDMYCNGYYFFEDLGLGYGLACEVPIKYANTWEELSPEQKNSLVNSFYPQILRDIERAIDWIKNRKIILTGTKNEIDHWEYIDNRTPDERKSTIISPVKNKKR